MRSFASLERKASIRKPPVKFVVFTEGLNTEPEYINALKTFYKNTLIEIEIEKAAGPPHTMANKAIEFAKNNSLTKRKRKNLDSFEYRDQVWVMFDRDTHDKIKESIDNCTVNDIGVAFSNPCFELWLILHFQDFDKPLGHHKVQSHLEGLCADYSAKAGKKTNCSKFIQKHTDAEKRAASMVDRRKKEGAEFQAPWTTVHHFTDAVRKAAS